MWKSQKDDKPKTRKRTGNSGGAGLILLALLIVLAGAAYFAFQEPTSTPPASGSPPEAKDEADFNSRCDSVHAAVDKVLSAQSLLVSDVRQELKEVNRQNQSGKIRWNARSSLIESTEAISTEGIKRALETGLKPLGSEVLKVEPDQYHGYSVTRFDIGFQDQLGGGPLTIISDRLYVVQTARKPAAAGTRQKTNTTNKGEIAIVIDDFGYRQDMIAEFAAIRRPFTFAVIPFKVYSKDAAAKGLASGHQVMLHLPMEPMSGIEPSEAANTVQVGMNAGQLAELIDKATHSLPGSIGVNNHQGSKATADRRTMEAVMKVLKKKGLFFVDSRTNGRSVAAEAARNEKVKTTENDIFIDGMADVAYVRKQLRAAGEMAMKLGSVTVIGHARPTTAAALREMIPELESRGIRFVFVSQLVR
ncbi:MAG: divergent polysaccharide deacetylase family protein [Negativicutes bacterium]